MERTTHQSRQPFTDRINEQDEANKVYYVKEAAEKAIELINKKNTANQILDPTWTTPVLKAESDSQAGQD